MAGEVETAGMKAVSTTTIAVPLQHHGAHVAAQHLARRAGERQKRILVRLDQRLDPLIGNELEVSRPAPAERRDEYQKPVIAASDNRPVHRHLLAGHLLAGICWPGSVSKRIAGSTASFGFGEASNSFSIV